MTRASRLLYRTRDEELARAVRSRYPSAREAAYGAALELRPHVVVVDAADPGAEEFRSALCRDHRTAGAVALWVLDAGLVVPRDADPIDDFLFRSWTSVELAGRIARCAERAAVRADVHPLTGLPGGRAALERMRLRLAAETRIALLHVDIDGFKSLNDAEGFVRGDEVIAAAATAILQALDREGGEGAFAAHLGGDDFLVLCDPDRAPAVAAAVIERFEAGGPPRTVSVGIAAAGPGEDPACLARLAAAAKADAKRSPGSAWARVHAAGPPARMLS